VHGSTIMSDCCDRQTDTPHQVDQTKQDSQLVGLVFYTASAGTMRIVHATNVTEMGYVLAFVIH